MMRSGLLALCGLLALRGVVSAQGLLPRITTHPDSVSVFVGDAVALTVAVEGDSPIALQWHKNGAPIPGAGNPTLFFNSAQLTDLALYHVVATNVHGTATSFPALVFVAKRPQAIAFAPAVTTVVAGSGVVLTATANSGLPVTLSLASGSATLNGNILVGAGGNVVVRATQAGNDFYAAAEIVERTFSFIAGALSPFITSPPLDQTVTAGSAVTLRATAIGTPAPAYQWQRNGSALPGATSPALTFAAVTLADAARYAVTVTNLVGTASASATLTVRAAPVIDTPPASQTIAAGDSVTFAVGVSGFPAPTYQWRKNGTAIAGATRNTFALAGALATDAGRFDVVATNALGSATSAAATLTVTARDFSGVYFGRFAGGAGEAALLVRADRTAVFLGHLPGATTGLVAPDVRVDLTGRFSTTTTLFGATTQSVTLSGMIDETAGTVAGGFAGVGAAFDGTRAARTGAASDQAGYHQFGLIGTATGRGFAIVAADGQTMLLTSGSGAPDSARGSLAATGSLQITTAAQATLDLTFAAAGGVAGTLRPNAGAAVTLLGVSETRAGTERLINLSVRSVTSPGAATLITGFVVTGTAAKQLLIRAAGPALVPAPFNVPNALADPVLQLLRGATAIAQNNDWGVPAANTATLTAAIARAGAFPFRAGSADAALLSTLTPGAYTVTVGGGTGVTLAEIYEVLETTEPAGTRRLINVSARGLVTPAAPLIAGFVIAGIGPQRVLLRGIGPTLGAPPFGIAGTLPNPTLTLFRDTTAVKTNDDWFRDPEAAAIRDAATRAGAFALGATSTDASILIFLEPGAYTVQVNSPANAAPAGATGIALVEIYDATP